MTHAYGFETRQFPLVAADMPCHKDARHSVAAAVSMMLHCLGHRDFATARRYAHGVITVMADDERVYAAAEELYSAACKLLARVDEIAAGCGVDHWHLAANEWGVAVTPEELPGSERKSGPGE